jgi:hypothetical protein
LRISSGGACSSGVGEQHNAPVAGDLLELEAAGLKGGGEGFHILFCSFPSLSAFRFLEEIASRGHIGAAVVSCHLFWELFIGKDSFCSRLFSSSKGFY